MNGARALRSEVVAVLKAHAVLIFGITDISVAKFFDGDAWAKSVQLEALRHKNNFLYAKEGTVTGNRIARYFRSECLARVSSLIWNSTVDNHF